MKNTELIKTNKGFDVVVDGNKTLTMTKKVAVNSFEIFSSFTEDSISSITKITFKKKNDN
jgi:hypothetical protein